MPLKSTIAVYLDDTNYETGYWVTGAITVLTLTSAAIFVLDTYEIAAPQQQVLNNLNWLILAIFIAEYGLRIWTAEHRWRYIFSFYGLVDFLTILPFGTGLIDLPGFKLLQWLKVLRLARLLGDRALLSRLAAADTFAIIRITFTILGIIFVYAGLIFQVEQRQNPDTFESFFDAAYFAVVTITTVGYGDIAPVSEAGRLCTMLMILTGIALIPAQLSDLIRRIVKMTHAVQIPCERCGWSIHDADASFCKRCGESLMMPPLFKQISEGDQSTVAWAPATTERPSDATPAEPDETSPSSQNPA